MARARTSFYAAHANNTVSSSGHRPSYRFDSAQGTVDVSSPPGTWQMQPHSRRSGQHRTFYGVILSEAEQPGRLLHIVLPEDGSGHITLSVPNDRLLTVPKEFCSVWGVSIEGDGTVYNESTNWPGTHVSTAQRLTEEFT